MMSEIPGITFHLNMVFLGAFPKQFPQKNKAGIPAVPGFLSSQNCSKYQLRHIDAAFPFKPAFSPKLLQHTGTPCPCPCNRDFPVQKIPTFEK